MKKTIFVFAVMLNCAIISFAQGAVNGHEYVDLGLPSGVKWATCNVGANSPYDFGDYFSWGETRTKREYSTHTHKNINVKNIAGMSRYDVATAKWGVPWRMPTKNELDELARKCSWEWTANGAVVTGPNGNSIFLPIAG